MTRHEAAPCIGKRVAMCHLTASSETEELKFVWSGNTWAFRDAIVVSNSEAGTIRIVLFVGGSLGLRATQKIAADNVSVGKNTRCSTDFIEL